jgi:cation transport ATPase
MCKETFDVFGLNDQRTAYEVEQFLRGVPSVEGAQADFIADELTIEYDESEANEEDILDYIERAGCKPSPRVTGVVDHIKTKLGTL